MACSKSAPILSILLMKQMRGTCLLYTSKTFFSLREFMASTLVIRKPSTNAPFLVERAIKFSSQLSAVSS